MAATRRQSEKQQSDNSKTKNDDAFDSANGGDMVHDSMSESESEGSDWELKQSRQFFYEFINLINLT